MHPDANSDEVTVAKLHEALETARTNLEQAMCAHRAAERNETSALNAYNEAAKKFDALVAEIRKNAPSITDWGLRVRRATPNATTDGSKT